MNLILALLTAEKCYCVNSQEYTLWPYKLLFELLIIRKYNKFSGLGDIFWNCYHTDHSSLLHHRKCDHVCDKISALFQNRAKVRFATRCLSSTLSRAVARLLFLCITRIDCLHSALLARSVRSITSRRFAVLLSDNRAHSFAIDPLRTIYLPPYWSLAHLRRPLRLSTFSLSPGKSYGFSLPGRHLVSGNSAEGDSDVCQSALAPRMRLVCLLTYLLWQCFDFAAAKDSKFQLSVECWFFTGVLVTFFFIGYWCNSYFFIYWLLMYWLLLSVLVTDIMVTSFCIGYWCNDYVFLYNW